MFRVGDKVRTKKATRHGMVAKGVEGVVTDVRTAGSITDGVVVTFMVLPSPVIAKMFGQDPNAPEPFNCLFPFSSVNRQIEKV